MKKLHPLQVFVFLTVILMVGVTAAAFYNEKHERKSRQDYTQYYWFDAATGNYTWRQNTVDYETQLTGYNQANTPPFTLREEGYTPSTVAGFPPQPVNPYMPA